ncbi:MAG: LuxR C-terminal-related transcriptional regulator [Candidatus Yanofskybacteria bacterium]|nr:LuxR C-terminal-related transcriptional regulator [Candidatus Yanofskybacteria bacterium]
MVVLPQAIPPLTRREEQVLREVGKGHSNKIIAKMLGMTVRTVKAHVSRFSGKLLRTSEEKLRRRELVKLAAEHFGYSCALQLAKPLTPREEQVLKLLREGASNQAIAELLGISVKMVKRHIHTLLEKIPGVGGPKELVVLVLEDSSDPS